MTQHGLDVIGAAKEHLGGATHLFARIDGGPASQVRFFTRDNGLSFVRSEKPESGWASQELQHSSGYIPERGEVGWWNATVDGAASDVADSLGLPNSWHVSTFMVFNWEEGGQPEIPGEGGPEIPPSPGKTIAAILYTDGTWEQK
jgi:hypothetical protein